MFKYMLVNFYHGLWQPTETSIENPHQPIWIFIMRFFFQQGGTRSNLWTVYSIYKICISPLHIISALASQITSLTIVYSTVYSRLRSKKTSKLRVAGLWEGNSPVIGEFPAQKASNAENVSIWWRHHDQVASDGYLCINHFVELYMV